MQRRYLDMAEKIDPNILRLRIIMTMLERAEEGDEDAAREAQLMAFGMGLDIAQIKAGLVAKMPEQGPTPKPEVPLLPLGGQVGGIVPSSAQMGSDLRQTPQEER